jgi:thiol-disulfide isomerase/thioredoxin
VIDKSQFKKAPKFAGVTGFGNTPAPIKLAGLRGKVVLVHFWTSTCSNYIHTIPYLNDWYQEYSNKGLVIVGVQTPEFNDEKNTDNVKTAVNNFQIKYPVIPDTQGDIRYSHIGEGGYDQTEKMIQSSFDRIAL